MNSGLIKSYLRIKQKMLVHVLFTEIQNCHLLEAARTNVKNKPGLQKLISLFIVQIQVHMY